MSGQKIIDGLNDVIAGRVISRVSELAALTASEIYEFLFTDLKGAVPEALTDAVLERLALHIRSHFISPAASRLEAIGEPVGWQHRIYYEDTKSWSEWRDGERPKYDNEYETRPLYTSPVQTREDGIREALKPFARVARQLDRDYPDYADNISVFFELTHGDFRRIAALLSQPEPKGDKT